MGKTKITKENLDPLVKKGLSDKEIAKILGFSVDGIYNARKNIYKIERGKLNENPLIKPTQRQIEILLGTLLGDASLRKSPKSKNPSFSCEHGFKQLEYNKWKFQELGDLNASFWISKRKTIDPRTGIYYESSVLRLGANQFFQDYYNMLYETGTKQIVKEYLTNFSALSLAVLFMDDGTKMKSSLRLYTQSFSIESLDILVNFIFDKWNMKFNIDKQHQLYLPAKYYSLFHYLVFPYMHETMKYKLHLVS